MIRVVEARGNHLQIGEQFGEQCRDIGLQLRDQFRGIWARKEVSIGDAIAHSQKYLAYARAFYEPYYQEMQGWARAVGHDLTVAEVFAWFTPTPKKGCTDLVFNKRVTADRNVYLVHNEDFDCQEEGYAVLAKVYPDDAPSFMAMCYGGIWFNAGVNAAGIGVGGNALSHTDDRVGVPGDYSFRKIYSARTIGEAMEYSTPPERSFSYCNVICDETGQMYAMEGSATDFAVVQANRYMAHTNHYLSPSMEKYDAAFRTKTDRSPGFYSDSIVRYNRADSLVKDALDYGVPEWDGMGGTDYRAGVIGLDQIKTIMRDHHNLPWAICRHPDERLPEHQRSKTVWSEIIDVTNRRSYVCHGNPCEGTWQEFKL